MARWIGLLLAILFSLSCGAVMAADVHVGADLQAISVNICCPGNYHSVQGSGTIILVPIGEEMTTWVLTAEHVVSGLRQVRDVIDKDGKTRKHVTYKDAEVVQERVTGGRAVGERRYDAKVVSVNAMRDIALLRMRIDGEFDQGASFYLEDEIPMPGVSLFHCGAPGGKDLGGTCSLTAGIVSRLGVRIPEFGGSEHGVYDQVTCSALSGSSGGLVAMREDGRLVGIITLGLSGADSFHWMVPVRSILDWAEDIEARWIFDPEAERPGSPDEIDLPLEYDLAAKGAGSEAKNAVTVKLQFPWPSRGVLPYGADTTLDRRVYVD